MMAIAMICRGTCRHTFVLSDSSHRDHAVEAKSIHIWACTGKADESKKGQGPSGEEYSAAAAEDDDDEYDDDD